MNKEADARDHQQHDQGELVEIKSEVGLETAGANPGRQKLDVRCRKGREAGGHRQHQGKGRAAEQQGHADHGLPREFLAEESVDGGAQQRQHRNQPEMQVGCHSLSRSTWSTFKVSRVR